MDLPPDEPKDWQRQFKAIRAQRRSSGEAESPSFEVILVKERPIHRLIDRIHNDADYAPPQAEADLFEARRAYNSI